jgi:hypothetical protein
MALQYSNPSTGFGSSTAAIQIISTATKVVQSVNVSVNETTISIALSAATIYQGGTVALTATLTPAQSGVPITFTSGTTLLGTAQTDATGIGTFLFIAHSTGTIPLMASFGGDGVSANVTKFLTVGPAVVVSATPSSVTILPGKYGAVTVSFAPSNGFSGTAALTCSVPVSFLTCAPASSSVAVSSTMPASVTAMITVAATTSSLAPRTPHLIAIAMLAPLGLLGVMIWPKKRRYLFLRMNILCLLTIGTLAASGCGSGGTTNQGSGNKAPSGSQLVTFTVTASESVQTANLTVYFQ